jgi:hypothetical protein
LIIKGMIGNQVDKFWWAKRPSGDYSEFAVISMRVPSEDPRDTQLSGESARRQIIRFHLCSTCGLLRVTGHAELAEKVSAVIAKILEA